MPSMSRVELYAAIRRDSVSGCRGVRSKVCYRDGHGCKSDLRAASAYLGDV
jgi:hypothetical protein